MSRDRAIELDEDVARVVRFMERSVTADRLQYVACHLPEVAALIWSPDHCAGLYRKPIHGTPLAASESVPVARCVDGDSVAARDTLVQM